MVRVRGSWRGKPMKSFVAKIGLVAVLGAFIGLGVGNPVQAASYTFSFGNVDGAVNGNVSGTIVLPGCRP
jgi:hypothetical protein